MKKIQLDNFYDNIKKLDMQVNDRIDIDLYEKEMIFAKLSMHITSFEFERGKEPRVKFDVYFRNDDLKELKINSYE